VCFLKWRDLAKFVPPLITNHSFSHHTTVSAPLPGLHHAALVVTTNAPRHSSDCFVRRDHNLCGLHHWSCALPVAESDAAQHIVLTRLTLLLYLPASYINLDPPPGLSTPPARLLQSSRTITPQFGWVAADISPLGWTANSKSTCIRRRLLQPPSSSAMTLQAAAGTTSSRTRRVISRSFNASLLGICGCSDLMSPEELGSSHRSYFSSSADSLIAARDWLKQLGIPQWPWWYNLQHVAVTRLAAQQLDPFVNLAISVWAIKSTETLLPRYLMSGPTNLILRAWGYCKNWLALTSLPCEGSIFQYRPPLWWPSPSIWLMPSYPLRPPLSPMLSSCLARHWQLQTEMLGRRHLVTLG